MKPRSNISATNLPDEPRPKPIDDPRENPDINPIREDVETVKEPPPKKLAQMGEGSYEGTERYAKRVKKYLKDADVDADAKAAAPKTAAEAAGLKRAEVEAASRSRAPGK